MFGEGLPYTAALLANGLLSDGLGSVYNLSRGPWVQRRDKFKLDISKLKVQKILKIDAYVQE